MTESRFSLKPDDSITQLEQTRGYVQFARYATVGIAQNLFGYILYLLITWSGIDPKITISFLYPIGFTISYIGNKKWAFAHTGNHSRTLFRFTLTHIIGYLFNLALLFILVDVYGYHHQYVQLLAIFLLVFYFFITLRIYVFKNES